MQNQSSKAQTINTGHGWNMIIIEGHCRGNWSHLFQEHHQHVWSRMTGKEMWKIDIMEIFCFGFYFPSKCSVDMWVTCVSGCEEAHIFIECEVSFENTRINSFPTKTITYLQFWAWRKTGQWPLSHQPRSVLHAEPGGKMNEEGQWKLSNL